MAKYIFKLTRRHTFPEGSGQQLLPDDAGLFSGNKQKKINTIMAFLDVTVPGDAEEISVYMSGYVLYQIALICFCRKKGIKLIRIYLNRQGKYYEVRSSRIVRCA